MIAKVHELENYKGNQITKKPLEWILRKRILRRDKYWFKSEKPKILQVLKA